MSGCSVQQIHGGLKALRKAGLTMTHKTETFLVKALDLIDCTTYFIHTFIDEDLKERYTWKIFFEKNKIIVNFMDPFASSCYDDVVEYSDDEDPKVVKERVRKIIYDDCKRYDGFLARKGLMFSN